jgi:hypothetical protein
VVLGLDSKTNLYVLKLHRRSRRRAQHNEVCLCEYVGTPSPSGTSPPPKTITDGSSDNNTQLQSPAGLALDSAGEIYFTNDRSIGGGCDTITVYPKGSNGDAGRSRTGGVDPAAGGEEHAVDGGGQGYFQNRPTAESAYNPREHRSDEREYAGGIASLNPKTPDFSTHLEFLVAATDRRRNATGAAIRGERARL